MRTRTISAALVSLLFLTMAACGRGNDGPEVASLALESSQASDIDSGTLLIVKDKGTLLRVVGRDSNGAVVELDPAGIEWSSSDEATLETQPLGGSCIVKGLKDWFDTVAEGADAATGYEPTATLTVSYEDLTVALPAAIVLNGDGHWQIQITGGALNGVMLPLDLIQHGRTLTHETTGAMAQIMGRAFTLSQLGYSFSGNFSARNKVEGTYMDDSGGQGSWTATKN